jgi:predicted dehydrogenase
LAPVVGLVGCGRWGAHVLRDLLALGARVAVAEPDPAARERAAAAGAAACVAEAGRLPPVAGLVVVTPASTHAGVVEPLLGRGVPVFVEKPLTVDAASAERLARTAPDRLFVMDKWRYHPGVEALAALARSGELGPVLGLRTVRTGWGVGPSDVDAVWTLVPHELSIALEVLGRIPRPRAAVAERLGGGLAALSGLLGGSGEPWLAFEASSRYADYRREVRLHCRDGVAVLADPYADHVLVTRGSRDGTDDGPQNERRPIAADPPLRRELAAFLDHLRGGPPPKSRGADGAAVVTAVAELRALAGEPSRTT